MTSELFTQIRESGVKSMPENKKKKYRKPEVKKIKLDAKTAVLGFCKNTGQGGGPSGSGCGLPFPACYSGGS